MGSNPNDLVKDVPTSELEKILADRKSNEAAKRERERKAYESNRNSKIDIVIKQAMQYSSMLVAFKTGVSKIMNEQQELLNQYGAIPANSKGGFSVTTSCGTMRVTRTRTTKPVWDERSEKAVELIKQFLADTIKKKDIDTFEVLMSFIARDTEGNLEYDKVMTLLQHEDRYTDGRWKEGLTLIKESYRVDQTGFGYDFLKKDDQGKWQRIELSFPSIKIPSTLESDEKVL